MDSEARYKAYDTTGKLVYEGPCQQMAINHMRKVNGGKLYYFGKYMADYSLEKGLHNGQNEG